MQMLERITYKMKGRWSIAQRHGFKTTERHYPENRSWSVYSPPLRSCSSGVGFNVLSPPSLTLRERHKLTTR